AVACVCRDSTAIDEFYPLSLHDALPICLSFLQSGNAFGADGILGTTDNYALRFITNNSERFTILGNGNVGVGDAAPSALFTVGRSEEHTSELQSRENLVCRLQLEKKKSN